MVILGRPEKIHKEEPIKTPIPFTGIPGSNRAGGYGDTGFYENFKF
ncbi:MAG TPA: hypothetical protein V6D13_01120 [Halomicronema sp.]